MQYHSNDKYRLLREFFLDRSVGMPYDVVKYAAYDEMRLWVVPYFLWFCCYIGKGRTKEKACRSFLLR